MERTLLAKALPELKKHVEAASARIIECRENQEESKEKIIRVEERLAAIVKRIEEFTGGEKRSPR